jgi:hypothetical protein
MNLDLGKRINDVMDTLNEEVAERANVLENEDGTNEMADRIIAFDGITEAFTNAIARLVVLRRQVR